MLQIRLSADSESELQEAVITISRRFVIERWKRPKQDGAGRLKCYLFVRLRDPSGNGKIRAVNKVPH